MKPTLVVLAAGMGSRYGGLKQIDPVGPHGEIILDYSIFDAIQGGFGKVVFVIRHNIESDFRNAIGKKWENKIEIVYAFQELGKLPEGFQCPAERVKPWGTGHAVLCAAEAVGQAPFAVINADDFYGRDGFVQVGKALSENLLAARHFMVGYPLKNTLSKFGSVSRGICRVSADNLLISVSEHTSLAQDGNVVKGLNESKQDVDFTGDEIVSMNFWGFMPSLFEHLTEKFTMFLENRGMELKSEYYLPSYVAESIQEKTAEVSVLTCHDNWLGVTYREDKPHVCAGILSLTDAGVYPDNLYTSAK